MKAGFRLSGIVSKLCVALLAFLGYSCNGDEEKEVICMYGTPTGDYEIKGSVTTEDNKPVANAAIRVTDPNCPSGYYSYSTTTSNNEGLYETSGNTSGGDLKVVCIPSDPTMEPDSTIVTMKYEKPGKQKDDGWYKGLAKATADFKLKRKGNNK